MNTHIKKILVSLIILSLSVCISIAQDKKVEFSIPFGNQCQNFAYFQNESVGYNYFLWTFVYDNETIVSPAFSPTISLNTSLSEIKEVEVKLSAWNDPNDFVTLDTVIDLYPSPTENGLSSTDWMVCSNSENTTYKIEPCNPSYIYQWKIDDELFTRSISNANSCEVIVDWKGTGNASEEITISLDVTSDFGCKSSANEKIILIGTPVPDVSNASILRKPSSENQSNVLLCLIDEQEKYFYNWNWGPPSSPNLNNFRTTEPYCYFADSIKEDFVYSVEISDKDFSYCTSIITYNPELDEIKSTFQQSKKDDLTIFPNPATNAINLYLNNCSDEKIRVAITDIYGKVLILKTIVTVVEKNSYSIDIQNLSPGLFFVEVLYSNGICLNGKFIAN